MIGVPGVALRTSTASAIYFCLEGESGERLGLTMDPVVSAINTEDSGSDLVRVSISRG